MGFRFFRRIKIVPGLRVNLSRSGVSTSVGRRGAWFTIGPRGTRETIGIPGTGVSYTEQQSASAAPHVEPIVLASSTVPTSTGEGWIAWLLAILVAVIVLALLR